MKKKPKVSVIIPVYNVEKYIENCLKSIINQTLHNIEIICINDGSTDNSLKVLDFYKTIDSRISIIIQKNKGLASTRNIGMQHATGTYIYFIDSDDILDFEALEKLTEIADKDKLDVLFFDAIAIYESEADRKAFPQYETTYSYKRKVSLDGIYTGQELYKEFQNINSYRCSACLQLIRREHLINNNISFFEGILYEDTLFTYKNLLSAVRVSHRNFAFYKRLIHKGSIITSEVTIFNVYSYLVVYIEMFRSLVTINPLYIENFYTEIYNIKKNIVSTYKKIKSEENLTNLKCELLNDLEKIILTNILCDNKVNEDLQKSLQSIKHSLSYRIGKKITFFPTQIRNSIRSFKKHGGKVYIKIKNYLKRSIK